MKIRLTSPRIKRGECEKAGEIVVVATDEGARLVADGQGVPVTECETATKPAAETRRTTTKRRKKR